MDKKFKLNFLKDSMATSIGQIATIGIQFLSFMIIARISSKEVFGLYSLSMAICLLFRIIGGLGIDVTLTKEISTKNSGKHVYFNAFLIRNFFLLFIGVFYLIFASSILPLLDKDLLDVKYLILIISILWGNRELSLRNLQAYKAFRALAFLQIITALLKLGLYLILFLFFNIFDLQKLLIIEVIYLLIAILSQYFVSRKVSDQTAKLEFIILFRLLKFSLYLYLSDILSIINTRANAFLIASSLGPISIAYYEIANKIPEAFSRLFVSFLNVFFPHITELFSEKKLNDAQDFIEKSLLFFSITISFFATSIMIFQYEITELFFSAKYIEAAIALSLMVLSFLLQGLGTILGYSLVADGHPKSTLLIDLPGMLLNIILGLFFIPTFGFMGAVYSLICGRFLRLLVSIYSIRKIQIHLKLMEIARPILLSVFFYGIFYLLIPANIYIKILSLFFYIFINIIVFKKFIYSITNLLLLLKSGKKITD